MFIFLDGRPVVLTFEQVEQMYYQAFIAEFGDISITQWRGSYEYQALYPAIQLMIENGAITETAMNTVLQSIATINEQIKRPAVLVSRVADRFAEIGYEATIRPADINTKGIVAICVDYVPEPTEDRIIADLIAFEMLPAGQFVEGSISLPYVLSNGQSIDVKWEIPTSAPILWRTTITRAVNSSYPVDDVDTIVTRFLENFKNIARLGMDITPASYYEITRDAPWASLILNEYSLDDGGAWSSAIIPSVYTDLYIAELPPANVVII